MSEAMEGSGAPPQGQRRNEDFRGGRGRGRGRGRPRGPRGPPTCYNCGEKGHIARECTNPRLEGEAREVMESRRTQYRRCFNCGNMGHISSECSKPPGNKACYSCGQEGHIARDCPDAAGGGAE